MINQYTIYSGDSNVDFLANVIHWTTLLFWTTHTANHIQPINLIIVVSLSAAHLSLHQKEQDGSSSDVRLTGYPSSYRCSVRFADLRENLGGYLIKANQRFMKFTRFLIEVVSIYVYVNFRAINEVES